MKVGVFMALEPLDYAPPPVESAAARHDRIYSALLVALAVFLAMGMVSLFFMSRGPTFSAESRGVLEMVIGVYGVLIAAMVVTLILRGLAPRAGRIATMGLNVVLLIVFPFGTALGIYGLLKVDKRGSPTGV